MFARNENPGIYLNCFFAPMNYVLFKNEEKNSVIGSSSHERMYNGVSHAS